MKKIIIVLILLLGAIGGTAFFYETRQKPKDNELTLYGNVEIRQTDLSFQIAGQIAAMYKEEGDSVQQGELLAILDDRDYRANVAFAKANVAKTLALKKDAETKFSRQAPLIEDHTISQLDYETLLNLKAKTEADYEGAVAQLRCAENQLAYTQLYAPENGTITIRAQELGATVHSGQTIYTLAKKRPVWVRAYINETDLGNIRYGMAVKVLTDTRNPQTGALRVYNGTIGYISPVAEFTPKTVQSTNLRTSPVYRIRVNVDDYDDFLKQGMPTTIKINLHSVPSAPPSIPVIPISNPPRTTTSSMALPVNIAPNSVIVLPASALSQFITSATAAKSTPDVAQLLPNFSSGENTTSVPLGEVMDTSISNTATSNMVTKAMLPDQQANIEEPVSNQTTVSMPEVPTPIAPIPIEPALAEPNFVKSNLTESASSESVSILSPLLSPLKRSASAIPHPSTLANPSALALVESTPRLVTNQWSPTSSGSPASTAAGFVSVDSALAKSVPLQLASSK